MIKQQCYNFRYFLR